MKQKEETYLKENIANAEEIRKKIHEETGYETKEILNRAKTLAANILNDAKLTAEKNRQDALAELEKKISRIKERIFSALNLEKKRVIMGEKSKFIEEVFSELAKCASGFRRQQEYTQFLKKIILEATDVIDTKNLEVIFSPLDEKIITNDFINDAKKICQNKINQELTLKFTKSDFNDIGFIVQSEDGRLIYDARFTSRVNLMRDDIYMDLLRKL
ncbi:MAG: V-type ATP synthase subunit E [Candidatus Omnitrophota bacterium]|jgi:vacuolar-type H+-ATPase subunit E/Vma4